MRILLFVCILIMQSIPASAYTTVITVGDYLSEILARTFVEDVVVLSRPGADGRIAFSELEKNKDALMIANTTSLFIAPNVSEAYKEFIPLNNFNVISVLVSIPNVVATPKNGAKTLDELLSKKTFNMGGFGYNSSCKYGIKELSRLTNTEIIYVPYTSVNSLSMDLVGGHVDSICTIGNIVDMEAADGTANVIANFGSSNITGVPFVPNWTKPTDVYFSIISNKGVEFPIEKLLKNKSLLKDNKVFNQFNLMIKSSKESKDIMIEQAEFWKNLIKN